MKELSKRTCNYFNKGSTRTLLKYGFRDAEPLGYTYHWVRVYGFDCVDFFVVTAEQSETIRTLNAQLKKRSEENAILHDEAAALLSEVGCKSYRQP